MKRIVFFLLSVFLSYGLFAQQKSETIDIVLDASESVFPDILVVNIDLKYQDKNEQQALNRLTEGISGQIKAIENAGFEKNRIKLNGFSIEELESWESGKQKKMGFEAIQSVSVAIPVAEKELVDKLLNNLSIHKNENLTVKVDSKLSEDLNREIKNKLIRKAIVDATQKAKLMAETLNVKLGKVKSVEYGDLFFTPRLRNSIRYVPPVINDESPVRSSNSYELLGISETEIAEKVHVTWYIE